MVSLMPGTAALICAYRCRPVNSTRRIAPVQRAPISSIAAWNRPHTCRAGTSSAMAHSSLGRGALAQWPQGLAHPPQLLEHGLGRGGDDVVRHESVLIVDE